MYTYMEYLQKCFFSSTNWNEDNIFSNITATSQALLEFNIPNGAKLDVSSKSSDFLASSFTLSNHNSINGSIAYLYSSVLLKNTVGTKHISLQDAISGFRTIEPQSQPFLAPNYTPLPFTNPKFSRDSLLYGRMYFPGAALEAMVIKKLSSESQLLIKCISNPQLSKNGTMIAYLQKNTPKYLRELIYSTNESLFGLRWLYNLSTPSNDSVLASSGAPVGGASGGAEVPKFDNSVLSVGTEVWYAAQSLSPGLSTALRYSTRSTSTGKPLTMTLACNPILGHISSTYTVKTSVASTFCSRYDFNWFLYASNLSLGFELYSYSNEQRMKNLLLQNERSFRSKPKKKAAKPKADRNSDVLTFDQYKNKPIVNPIQNLDNYYHINPTLLPSRHEHEPKPKKSADKSTNVESAMSSFQNMVNDSNFSSVLKISTSMNDQMVRILWEGKFKDFLVSTGVQLSARKNNVPEVGRIGLNVSYAC